jgi:hypothetical protein
MKNERIKLQYGYNTITVYNLRFLTLKVRVKNSFPFDQLPDHFTVEDCKVQTNKVISYAGIDSQETRHVILKFTNLMLNHKIDEAISNHTMHLLPVLDCE